MLSDPVCKVTYEDALCTVLYQVGVLPSHDELLTKCYGQVAASDVCSSAAYPRFSEAGPDGYALSASDVAATAPDTPVTLRIGETVRAGAVPTRTVKRGEAARVMTGSIVPEGADCVVRFEDTDEPADKNGPNADRPAQVRIFAAATAGTGLFAAGSLIPHGAVVVPKGTVIGPGQVSALSYLGVRKLDVVRRPVVAILASGDELTSAPGPLPPGRIHNANSPALAELVRRQGGIPKILGIARDKSAALGRKLAAAVAADVILTSGGVSKGDFDLVRLVLGQRGAVVLHHLKMGPGGSFTFGSLARADGSRIPVFALAGPPAGCLVNFELLVRPALRKMLGYPELRHAEVEAEAMDSIVNRKPFDFVRWTELTPSPAGFRVRFNADLAQGFLMSMGRANALTILPTGAAIRPGDRVRVLPLDWAQ
jgi:molybdopterin molybdotransferase